jgi:fatty acid desaturase
MPHKDPDMHHAPFAWRVSEVTPHIWYMRLQVTYLPVIWGILVFYMRFIVDTLINQTGSYNFIKNHEMSRKDRITNALVSVMTFMTMFFWPALTDFSLEKKIAFSIIPYVIYSWCFGMATQLNHTTPETMDIAAGADWYEHQCLTSHTFAPQSVFWLIMTGGLNLQVEHHLFPGVNSWHLMKIQPIVEECCKKHGIQYNLSQTATEGVRKYLKQLWRVGNIKSA